MSIKPRVRLPEIIKPGDVIEVKTLVTHVMETGNRKNPDGTPIPRNIINLFVAKFEGQEVFRAALGSGIAANPYLAFFMRVPGPGQFEFSWTDDQGVTETERTPLTTT